jgi:hypothetical protein
MLSRVFAVVALLVLSVTNAIAMPSASAAAELDRRLGTSVESYSIDSENLLQALAKFSDDFQVPLGIEWQISKVAYMPLKRQYEKSTVRQIVADMVTVEAGYTMSVSNGVIHVSKTTIFDDGRNFLNIPIDDFELSSEFVFQANNRLRKLVAGLTNPELPRAELGCAGSFGVGAGDRKVSFHLPNVVVRDILDKFVTSAGFNIWLVTFPEIATKGFFKTTSIFSPGLPESELPAWDLLLPGYDPVRKQMGTGWRQRQSRE